MSDGYGWYGVFIPTFRGGPYFACFADNRRDARKQFRDVFGPVPKGSERLRSFRITNCRQRSLPI